MKGSSCQHTTHHHGTMVPVKRLLHILHWWLAVSHTLTNCCTSSTCDWLLHIFHWWLATSHTLMASHFTLTDCFTFSTDDWLLHIFHWLAASHFTLMIACFTFLHWWLTASHFILLYNICNFHPSQINAAYHHRQNGSCFVFYINPQYVIFTPLKSTQPTPLYSPQPIMAKW